MELSQDRWNEKLRKIKPAVKQIFYEGNLNLLFDDMPKLAIVGSRRMTGYGQAVIEKWMPELVRKEVVIVSGFMYGVDQAAHKACIENGGKTIAVLGYGMGTVAESDKRLYQKLLEVDSLILSEYSDSIRATKWTFPLRNRIVAGIADAVLVVEGAEKSGSMITANLANLFGKTLMAVPGQVTGRISAGTNALIKSGKANMVTSAEEVLNRMGLSDGQIGLKTIRETPILSLLSDGERSVDEISRLLNINIAQVLSELTELALCGLICENGGKFRLK